MLNKSKELFSAWNEAGLLYCILKGNEHLSSEKDEYRNHDVLLSFDDNMAGEVILLKLKFLHCRSEFGSRYSGIEDWIGFDEVTGKLLLLHIHIIIVKGERGHNDTFFPWSKQALLTRILDKDSGVYAIEPALELLTLYYRIILKSECQKYWRSETGIDKSPNAVIKKIQYLKSQVNWSEFQDLASNHYGENAAKFVQIVKKDCLAAQDFLDMYKIVKESLNSYSRYKKFQNCLYIYFCELSVIVRKIIKKIYPNLIIKNAPSKGLIIAFIGQDGAGKSTVTNDILKWLTWKLEARYTYLGVGTNYKSWRKTLQEKLSGKKCLKILRAWLAITKYTDLAHYVYNRIISAESYSKYGGIQIFDRYPQTMFPGISDGPKLRTGLVLQIPKTVRFLFSHYVTEEEKMLEKAVTHSPDVVLKLLISPEESVRRKPENNLEVMIKKHDIIKKLNFTNSEVVEIDASMPYEEEMVLIKQIIWKNLIRKNMR